MCCLEETTNHGKWDIDYIEVLLNYLDQDESTSVKKNYGEKFAL